jgi:predicted nucleotidyltransferase
MMANTDPTPATFLEQILARCQAHLVTDSRVLGLCVFGSLAIGHTDEFSDIDLGILVEQDQLDTILADRDLIRGVAPLLISGPALADDDCVFALHDVDGRLVKVDYNYFSDNRPPPWLSSESRVLFDHSSTLAELIALPGVQQQPASIPSDAFWVEMWSAARMVRRGELFEACDILNHLRDPVLTRLLSQVHGVPFQNYRRLEELYPTEIVERLRHTFARPDQGDLENAIAQLAALYLDTLRMTGEGVSQEVETAIDRILEFASITDASHGVNP